MLEIFKNSFEKHPAIAAFFGGILGGILATIIMIHKNLGPLSEWISGLFTLGAICITIYIQYDSKKIKLKFVDFKQTHDGFEYETINGNTERYAVFKQEIGVINLSAFNVEILKAEVEFDDINESKWILFREPQILIPYSIKYFEIPKDLLMGIIDNDLKDGQYYGTLKITDFRGVEHIGEKKQIHQLVLKNRNKNLSEMTSW